MSLNDIDKEMEDLLTRFKQYLAWANSSQSNEMAKAYAMLAQATAQAMNALANYKRN